MEEVAAIARATNPNATLLVVDAMSGQDAVSSAQAFHEKLALTGVVLTKTDGDARGGAAVSLRAVTGRPILFVGTGETIDALDAFHPDRMAGRILGMGDVVGLVEKAQAAIDEKEAQRSVEKMVLGDFTLEDMLAQLRMLRKLGPMKKVLGMLPGMGDIAKQINIDDKQMNRLEALFTSMTPRERLQPDVLDMSRRRRIARGAGQEVAAVNELLKRYKDMKLVMKQMGKMGLAAQLGAKEKEAALRQMGAGDATGGSGAGGGGLLGGMFGGGGGGGFPGLGGGLGGLGGKGLPGMGSGPAGGSPFGTRPMGQSATRQSGKKKDKKKRR
jgi:signal recognition particle subunit SRP54